MFSGGIKIGLKMGKLLGDGTTKEYYYFHWRTQLIKYVKGENILLQQIGFKQK